VGDGLDESWTWDELVQQVGAPLEDVATALYRLIRHDASWDRFAILNPGCSEQELDAAEGRIGHRLHPLHRRLLRLSNGGTLPILGLGVDTCGGRATGASLAHRRSIPDS